MSPGHNPYGIEPAEPTLAHNLLPCPKKKTSEESEGVPNSSPPQPSSAWNLQDDIDNGFHAHSNGVFRYGTVIGFSRLRNNNNETNTDEFIGNLPRALITAHLSRPPPSSPRVYIIHPANCDAFSPQKLLSSLLLSSASRDNTHPLRRDEAISRLDSVQLLPVFDFPAAAQAVSEVSDIISPPPLLPQPRQRHEEHSVLVVVVGLDALAEGVVRASNTARGAAVLTTVLRSLTQLARAHAPWLSVMLVNTNGVGAVGSEMGVNRGQSQSQTQTQIQTQQAAASYGGEDGRLRAAGGEEIHSAFRASDVSLFPSLLMRTMDYGIDTHVLLSKVHGTGAVEVVKDRVGDGVGKWAIWEGKG
ncbi:hypothetical protein FE257_012425 [Aspergillus nanangensis]|uniref:Uncharacterized protein n=1 Tax=Aspergillus nanangensis TaxID=2582783 RepID=A0AAD4CUL0_ASPNN|nr:hypothetical protein FE257_012425 [Aspergillus nanangensis]